MCWCRSASLHKTGTISYWTQDNTSTIAFVNRKREVCCYSSLCKKQDKEMGVMHEYACEMTGMSFLCNYACGMIVLLLWFSCGSTYSSFHIVHRHMHGNIPTCSSHVMPHTYYSHAVAAHMRYACSLPNQVCNLHALKVPQIGYTRQITLKWSKLTMELWTPSFMMYRTGRCHPGFHHTPGKLLGLQLALCSPLFISPTESVLHHAVVHES